MASLNAYDTDAPWLRRQPTNYQAMLDNMGGMDEKELSLVGKQAFEKVFTMTKTQTSVFWSTFKARKKTLDARSAPAFNKIHAFLTKTKRPVGWQKKYLFELKQRLYLTNGQWSKLWEILKGNIKESDPQIPLFGKKELKLVESDTPIEIKKYDIDGNFLRTVPNK